MTAPSATPSIKEVDILNNPYARLIDLTQQQITDKRTKKASLTALQKDRNGGRQLTMAQVLEVSCINDVEAHITCYENIMRMLVAEQREYDKARIEKAKYVTGSDEFFDGLLSPVKLCPTVRKIVEHGRIIYDIHDRPIVRKSFEAGDYGALEAFLQKLSDADFLLVDELHNLFFPSAEGCKETEYTEKLDNSSVELSAIYGSKTGNDDEKATRCYDLLTALASCEYFETLKQSAAAKKERKAKRKEEEERKKEEEEEKEREKEKEKEEETREEEKVEKRERGRCQEDVRKMQNGNEPKVVLPTNPLNGSAPPMQYSFGYDDSLPHPAQFGRFAFPPQGAFLPPGLPQMQPVPNGFVPQQPMIMAPPSHLAHMGMPPQQQQFQQLQQLPPQMQPQMQHMQQLQQQPIQQVPPMQQQMQPHMPMPLMQPQQPVNTFINQNGRAEHREWEQPPPQGLLRPSPGPNGGVVQLPMDQPRRNGQHNNNHGQFDPPVNHRATVMINGITPLVNPNAGFGIYPNGAMGFPTNGIPNGFRGNGFRTPQLSLNALGGVQLNGNPLPQWGSGYVPPHTTSVNSNGQPFPTHRSHHRRGHHNSNNGGSARS